jgi:Ni,Fe-hydrogenase I cytochrome b subunit
MASSKDWKLAATVVQWVLAALALLFIVTGFGITQSSTVTPLTLGLLTKAVATQIHLALPIPFIIVLALHVYIALARPKK